MRSVLGAAVVTAALVWAPEIHAQDRVACLRAYDEGQAARDERRLTRARAAFTTCASSSCPGVLRKDCLVWLDEVDMAMPSLVLRAVDGRGRDRADVRVELDGSLLMSELDGKAVAVDPGAHTLVIRAKGLPPAEQELVIAEGEKNRVLVVHLPEPETTPADTDVSSPRAAPETPRPPSRSLVVPLVLSGASVLALSAAGYFYWTGIQGGEALRDDCGSPTPSCSRRDVDDVHTKLLVGDVLLGAGLVAAAGLVLYLILSPPSSVAARGARAHGAFEAPRVTF